ncbi:hypothetical protein [Gynuella sp.]|uniref:CIS tube protein n=1 Tax=Gynuella sp. TaxID=2969146 RepID=UPI003D11BB77
MSSYLDASRLTLPMLKITGYQDNSRSKKITSVSLPFLQESLNVDQQQSFNVVNAQNNQEVITGTRTAPTGLKVTFVLDDTTFATPIVGSAMFLMPKTGKLPMSVEKQLKTLADICYSSQKKNALNYLTIQSRNMPLINTPAGTFHCVLKSMKVKNELVDIWGDRIKALVECEFQHCAKEDTEAGSASIASLTSNITLDAGTGPALAAAAAYGSVAFAAALAAANGMNSFRGNHNGTSLKAPPISQLNS